MGRRAVLLFGSVVATVVIAGCASRTGGTRPASPSLAGTAWTLVSVRDGGRVIVLPGAHPRLDFGRDGSIVLDDTVNTVSGRYRADGAGFTVSRASTTLVGYAGSDPRRRAIIAAVDSIAFQYSHGTSRPSAHVTTTRAGDTLLIRSQHYELRYRAAGAYATLPHPHPTTSSR